jgi:hypothetical protein
MPAQFATPISKNTNLPPPRPEIITKRTASARLAVTSDLLTATLGKSSGYAHLGLDLPSLSGFAPEPGVPIQFDVSPQPIGVTLTPAQTIVITPGVPAKVTLSVNTAGGDTIFVLGSPSGVPAKTKIELPSSAAGGKIEIGAGLTVDTDITISADFEPGVTSSRKATIKWDWSADGGLSKDTISLDIEVLPSTISFTSGNLDASGTAIDVKGEATWILNADGSAGFSGVANTHDVFPDTFVLMGASNYVDPKGNLYTVVATGNPSLGWNIPYADPRFIAYWPGLCANGATFKLSVVGIGTEFAGELKSMATGIGIAVAIVVSVIAGVSFAPPPKDGVSFTIPT